MDRGGHGNTKSAMNHSFFHNEGGEGVCREGCGSGGGGAVRGNMQRLFSTSRPSYLDCSRIE